MKHKLIYIVGTLLILASAMTLQAQQTSQTSLWKIRSFDMGLTNRGIAVGGTWRHNWSTVYSSPLQISTLFYKESDKIPYVDPYTGRYVEPPSKKLVFLNIRSGLQRRLWTQSLAPNVQPYILTTAGPTIALDPPNTGGFFSRWKNATASFTGHAFVGGGVDFVYSRRSQFSVTIGYELIYFPTVVDGSQNYSGITIMMSFGERL